MDLGGTSLAIFSLPLEEIYQDHTCTCPSCHRCVCLGLCATYCVGFCTHTYVGYVLKLYLYCLHTYILHTVHTYVCMLVHCVSIHIYRKCAILSTTSTASTCGPMLVYATSTYPHPSADHKVPLPTCKVPLPRVHVRRKIIRGENLWLQ